MALSESEPVKWYEQMRTVIDEHRCCTSAEDVQRFEDLWKAVNSMIWIGNNILNYGGDQFRSFLEAAIEDAKRAYYGRTHAHGRPF
jgi:hypothetical protein